MNSNKSKSILTNEEELHDLLWYKKGERRMMCLGVVGHDIRVMYYPVGFEKEPLIWKYNCDGQTLYLKHDRYILTETGYTSADKFVNERYTELTSIQAFEWICFHDNKGGIQMREENITDRTPSPFEQELWRKMDELAKPENLFKLKHLNRDQKEELRAMCEIIKQELDEFKQKLGGD